MLYTVTARVRGDVDQANWMDASFRTAPQGIEQDAISTVLVDVVPGRTSVTLTAVNDNAATLTDGIEYALCAWDAEPTVWQDSPSFDGLELNFGYKAAARYKATATAPAGETVSVTFMIPEGQQQTAEAPAFLEVADVTDTTATVKAYDRYQDDMTAQCEFSLDGNVWQDSPSFTGLTPDTSYNVYGRTKATGELAASAPVSLNFTTAPSADAGDEQGQVWVNEYRLVSVGESKAHGLGIKTSFGDDVVFYRDDDNPEAGTSDEMVAAYNALSAYLEDMLDVDAPYNDGWDRVTAVNNHSYWKLVKTGGHYETYDTAAEKAQLYAHGDSVITQNQRMVDGDDSHYKFTFQTSDGMTFDKKKEAWNHCQQASASIVSADVVSASDAEGILYYQDVDDMIAAADGTPGEAWCLAGTTILG